MEVFLLKTPIGLKAYSDIDADALKKIKIGEVVKAEITKPRNVKFHRKFMALMQLVFENQTQYAVFEDLLIEVKLKTGHYTEHITTNGVLIYVPKSISFASMDEYEFNDFYTKALNILGKLIKIETEDLRKQVDQFYE